jgi:hypothetical protein
MWLMPQTMANAPWPRDLGRSRLVCAQRYAKPSNLVWLAESVILGVIFFTGFFAYLALADRSTKAQIEIRKLEDSTRGAP